MHNVGHVGKIVISVEEAIAKGTRRIVALTGPEASRAIHRADRLEQRVDEAHAEISADKTIALDRARFKMATRRVIELIEEVNQTQLPYCRKEAIREKAKGLQKVLDARDREAKAAVAEQVSFTLAKRQEHIFASPKDFQVLDGALKSMKKASATMGFSVNDETGKVVVVARVPKDLAEKGLKASEWITEVCSVLGGRGGGTATQAQATGTNTESVDEAAQLALKFAKVTLS
ncbi:unnamed protein product [Gongylonema pulchrum]|uniref:DHHA1 domain-containing protein n=1 Tax=Gongylonema pulchrum TaxID=637853 RepID=A0A3P6PDP4_9BILA|nr:unnamed protein product [Gongylonema pulchrum]